MSFLGLGPRVAGGLAGDLSAPGGQWCGLVVVALGACPQGPLVLLLSEVWHLHHPYSGQQGWGSSNRDEVEASGSQEPSIGHWLLCHPLVPTALELLIPTRQVEDEARGDSCPSDRQGPLRVCALSGGGPA